LFALLVVLLAPLAALIVLGFVTPAFGQAAARTFGAIAVVMAIAAVMLARRLFFPGWDPPSGPSDNDGGGGSGPPEPPPQPGSPRGGIPLPDAEQSRHRIRDHDRPDRRRLRPRRPAREPERSPALPAPDR
jgi:hypothetical protein